jgi:hypothetical protein
MGADRRAFFGCRHIASQYRLPLLVISSLSRFQFGPPLGERTPAFPGRISTFAAISIMIAGLQRFQS